MTCSTHPARVFPSTAARGAGASPSGRRRRRRAAARVPERARTAWPRRGPARQPPPRRRGPSARGDEGRGRARQRGLEPSQEPPGADGAARRDWRFRGTRRPARSRAAPGPAGARRSDARPPPLHPRGLRLARARPARPARARADRTSGSAALPSGAAPAALSSTATTCTAAAAASRLPGVSGAGRRAAAPLCRASRRTRGSSIRPRATTTPRRARGVVPRGR